MYQAVMIKYLAHGHNTMTPVRPELGTSPPQVEHSSTESLRTSVIDCEFVSYYLCDL